MATTHDEILALIDGALQSSDEAGRRDRRSEQMQSEAVAETRFTLTTETNRCRYVSHAGCTGSMKKRTPLTTRPDVETAGR